MSNLAIVSLLLGALWAPLLYFAYRHRDPLYVAIVLWIWAANYLIGTGHITEGRMLSIPWVLTVVALLVDRLNQHPEHVRRVAATQVNETRREFHDKFNDALAEYARDLAVLRRENDELRAQLEQS